MDGGVENAYEVLGLSQGPNATPAEIRQAYRRLALAKHPDKNKDKPDAATEFALLQSSYALLNDADARAALDALIRVREAQRAQRGARDAKRQRLVDELERREAAAQGHQRREASAAAQLAREVARLRREAAERAEQEALQRRESVAKRGEESARREEELQERLDRTLKVAWIRADGEYGAAELRRVFEAHGAVEEVVLRPGKKHRARAAVVMGSLPAARQAARAANGLPEAPLMVQFLTRGDEERDAARGEPRHERDSRHLLPGNAGAAVLTVDDLPAEPLFPAARHMGLEPDGVYGPPLFPEEVA